MKQKHIILSFLFVFCGNVLCQQVTREEAVDVAKAELLYTKGLTVNITYIHQFDSNGHTLLYEVVSDRGINVLVTGNKLCLPVVGRYKVVDNTSIFDRFEELPCGLKLFIQNYKEQVEYSFQTRGIESTHESEWNGLINQENIYSNRDIGYVEPLLTTKWGQSGTNFSNNAGYNYYIQSGDTCNHCLVGCVAVAMGQVMNYWKWPVLTADNWQFDWCNMSDMLNDDSVNYFLERNAVARLLERCGKRAKMDYGCSDSESNVYKAKRALDKFGYNDNSDHRWRLFHRRTWEDDLRENLDNGWPVIYGACGLYDPDGLLPAHAFVCDGYSSDGKFHFNWGLHNSYLDDYFLVDDLCPGNHNFNLFNSALFDLRPDGEIYSYCDLSLPLDVFYQLYIISNPDSNIALYNVTPQTFKKLTSASSTSPASYRTIPAGATAEYVAHKEIVLQPGFTAEYGSEFTARIEPCAACEERMTQMEMLTSGENGSITDTTGYEMRVFRSGDTVILAQPSSLHLYPNPTGNTLTVKSPEKIEDIRIFDNMGRPVFRWFIESNADGLLTLNVRDIPDGVYILQLTTSDKKSHLGRFVKR